MTLIWYPSYRRFCIYSWVEKVENVPPLCICIMHLRGTSFCINVHCFLIAVPLFTGHYK